LLDRFVGPGPWWERLPTVLGPREPAGDATDGACADLGLTGRVLVAAGTGDNMAAALGVGLARGQVAMSLGTSGTVFAPHDRPSADPTGIVAGFADATGGFLPLVCTLNATRVTATFAAWMGVSEEELDRSALAAGAGSGGAVLVPYLDGERTPNRPGATGTLTGLGTGTTRAQIARAAYEGVVCGLLDGFDALTATTGVGPERIVLVGGGARSRAYRRVLADLSGLEVLVPAVDEQVAAGACVQAAAVVTGRSIADVQRDWNLAAGSIIEPDPAVDRDAIRHAYQRAARAS
jgi:xylulokinase